MIVLDLLLVFWDLRGYVDSKGYLCTQKLECGFTGVEEELNTWKIVILACNIQFYLLLLIL